MILSDRDREDGITSKKANPFFYLFSGEHESLLFPAFFPLYAKIGIDNNLQLFHLPWSSILQACG